MSRASPLPPEEFDALLLKHGPAAILAREPKRDVDSRILWARAALASNQPLKLQRACQLLGGSRDPLAIGVYAALISQMRQWRETLALRIPGKPETPRDWDARAWLHLAASTAHSSLGRDGQALVELGHGIQAAEMAGMKERAQLLRFHVRMVEVRLGIARPEDIERDLQERMPEGRRVWLRGGSYVAAILQGGEYNRASKSAEIGTHWHTAALGLIGAFPDPGLRTPGHLAGRAWAQAWAGQPVDRVTGLGQSVVATYGHLAFALDLSRTVRGAQLVEHVIGTEPPAPADQAVLWAAVSLMAMMRGGSFADPLRLVETLTVALGRLRHVDDVMELLTYLMPEAVLLAGSAPGAHPELVVASNMLLRRNPLPRADEVAAAYAQQDVPTRPGRAPNIGAVMVGMELLVETAEDQERTALARQWQSAREALLFDYRARGHVPGVLDSYHCETVNRGRTLEA